LTVSDSDKGNHWDNVPNDIRSNSLYLGCVYTSHNARKSGR
jgi:hypothetical protein